MKRFFCIVLSAVISTFAFAQGITKNGMITTDGSTYVNKNGAVGLATGIDINGQIVAAVSLPSVTTTAITSIRGTTASSGGNVTSTGGLTVTDRGVCWSTASTPEPTISDNILSQGSGAAGAYASNLSGLAQNTLHYLRAYATNSEGTAYGETLSFTTTSIAIGDNMQGGIVYALVRDGNDNVTGGSVVSGDKGKKSRYDLNSTVTDANSGTGLGGFKDWFAPSAGQLIVICNNKNSVGMRNVTVGHWSSDAIASGSSGAGGYIVEFFNCAAQFNLIRNPGASQDNLFNVRLIRNFTL